MDESPGHCLKEIGQIQKDNYCIIPLIWSPLLFSSSVMSNSLRPHGLQHAKLYCLPEFSQTHIHWISDAIQSSHPLGPASFSSCPQSFPASGSFPVSQLFASWLELQLQATVLPMNTQGWFPLGLTGLISLLSLKSPVQSNSQNQKVGQKVGAWGWGGGGEVGV